MSRLASNSTYVHTLTSYGRLTQAGKRLAAQPLQDGGHMTGPCSFLNVQMTVVLASRRMAGDY